MNRIVFTPTARQRRRQRIGALIFLLLASVVQLRIILAHIDTRGLAALEAVFVMPFVLACLLCVGFSLSRTVVNQDGISTLGLWHHRADWWNVRAIDVVEQSSRGGTDWKVRVATTDGKAFKLFAPSDSTNGSDPEFSVKVEQINDRWRAITELRP